MDRFQQGTEVRICGTFRVPPSPDLVEPTAPITITVRRPDLTSTTLTSDRLAAGEYAANLLLTQSGRWNVRFASGGAVAEQEFYVEPSKVI